MTLSGTLDNRTIAGHLIAADREMERRGVENDDRLRFRLSLEEVLLAAQETFGTETRFHLDMRIIKGRQMAVLTIRGPEKDLLSVPSSPVLARVLDGWESAPVWNYEAGENRVTYSLQIPASMIGNLRFTWEFTKNQRATLFLAIAAQIVTVVMKVVVPIVSARVIVAYVEGSVEQILLSALMLMVVNMITDAFAVVCNRLYNVVYNKTLTALENNLVHEVLRVTTGCLDEKGAGLFIQRLTTDTGQLATAFNTFADLLSQTFTYIGILGAILITSPPVFAVVFLLFAGQVLIELYRTRILNADDRIYRNANERFTGFVGEMVHGAKDVKLMHNESMFERELDQRITEANDTRMKRDGRSWKYKLIRWELAKVGGFLFAVLLAFMLSRKMIAPAIVIVLYNYYISLDASAVLLLGQVMEFVKDFNLSNERVRAIVQSREFSKEKFGNEELDRIRGDISFDRVWFSYDTEPGREKRWVIRDMSFHILPGRTIAFVGRSGCGKSTVFNLITGLYTISGGSIKLDGAELRDLSVDSIRNNIAVVSQNPYLFNMSIQNNLRLAKPDMTEDEMRRVCELACISEDIEAMQDGYDSTIGEGGVSLSGGQRQRLAIARALLKDCSVLLLDEATSALDNQIQREIQTAINNIRGDRTILIIAHRLSTIVDADEIMFIEDGRVLDHGSHEELLARCSSYRKLYEAEAGNSEAL